MLKRLASISFLTLILFNATGQKREYDCLVLEVSSEVLVNGAANIGTFQCSTVPISPDEPLPSCFEKGPGYIRITDVQFEIPVAEFDCGNPLILADLKDLLESKKHPTISFTLKELLVRDVSGLFYEGEVTAETIVRGVSEDVIIPVEVDVLGSSSYRVAGKTTIKLSCYGIAQPSRLFGLITLKDEVDVCFELYFTKVAGKETRSQIKNPRSLSEG